MELDNLVTQDNADTGVWTPVELYGKPADFDLLILGDDSDAVQQYSRKSLKKLKSVMGAAAKNKEPEFDDDTVDELADSTDESVLVRIAGIRGWKRERDKKGKAVNEAAEPVTLNGTELKNDKESYKLLISKIPAIKEFVLNKARDRTNFLSQPSGN
jgi:hypothetical protein